MKISELISRFDDIYIEGLAALLFILGFHIYVCFGLLFIYLICFYKRINWFRCLILGFIICVGFFVVNINNQTRMINDEVKIVDIDTYDNCDRLTVRYQYKKYYIYVYDHRYSLGDHIYIKGEIIKYEHERVPFGFDAYDYFVSKGIYGLINIDEINYISSGFNIFSFRDQLLSHYGNTYLRCLIFGEQLDKDMKETLSSLDIIFLMNLSGIHVFALIMMVKKGLFYLNIEEKYQKIIILLIYIGILYLSKIDLSILRLTFAYIIILINKKYNHRMLKVDRHILTFLVLLLLDYHLLYSIALLMMFIIIMMLDLTSYLYNHLHPFKKRYVMSWIAVLSLLPFQNHISILYLMMMPIMILLFGYVIYPLLWLMMIAPKLTFIDSFVNFIYQKLLLTIEQYQLTIEFHSFNNYFKLIIFIVLIWFLLSKTLYQRMKKLVILMIIIFLPTIVFNHVSKDLFYMIDVGQGDGFYIRVDDINIVVDCYENTLEFLKDHGINHIDYLILTHSDEDHILEANRIISEQSVNQIILNAYDDYEIKGSNIRRIKAGEQIDIGSEVVEFYNPILDYGNTNNNSLVFKICIGDLDFLFTGDIESKAEEQIIEKYENKLKSDVLKIGHHGSDTSTSNAFLDIVSPKYALISVGKNNRFHFPAYDILKKLELNHIKTYRTDISGTVIYQYQFKRGKWSTYL